MDRRTRLAAIAEVHDQWVSDTLPAATFDPDNAPPLHEGVTEGDYNQHHLDADATAAQEADLFRRLSQNGLV